MLSEKKVSVTDGEELNQTVERICAEYRNMLLKKE
jgi:hypothetical protein